MAANSGKSIFKRDANGRTLTQRYEKVEAAVKTANTEYKQGGRFGTTKEMSPRGRADEKSK